MIPAASPRLFLIDGSSYIYRAFFALPELYNAAGLPTNAILGFTNMMIDLLKRYQPDYVLVALDAGRDTFRQGLFDAYKANRLAPPANLVPQLPFFRKVLQVLGIPLFELPGYEADDIIATLCHQQANEDCEVVVVSGDKDLMQLVSDRVKLLDVAKNRWVGFAEVIDKFGVAPDRVTHVMGLMGDSSDNIPGIKGIGRKTAMALIRHFHTLEDLFTRLDELSSVNLRGAQRIRQLLESGKEWAFLSRDLATVRRDVPLALSWSQLRYGPADLDQAAPLFRELGFTNLLALLENGKLG
jgi:5'-3' exonuclease